MQSSPNCSIMNGSADSSPSQVKKQRPALMYSLGGIFKAAISSRRLWYFSSKRSIQYGTQPTPASRNATLRLGKRSSTPLEMIEMMEIIGWKGCDHIYTPEYY